MTTFAELASKLDNYTKLLQLAVEKDDLEHALQLAERRNHLIEQLTAFAGNELFKNEVSSLAERLVIVDAQLSDYIKKEKNEVENKLLALNNFSSAIKKYTNYSQG